MEKSKASITTISWGPVLAVTPPAHSIPSSAHTSVRRGPAARGTSSLSSGDHRPGRWKPGQTTREGTRDQSTVQVSDPRPARQQAAVTNAFSSRGPDSRQISRSQGGHSRVKKKMFFRSLWEILSHPYDAQICYLKCLTISL